MVNISLLLLKNEVRFKSILAAYYSVQHSLFTTAQFVVNTSATTVESLVQNPEAAAWIFS